MGMQHDAANGPEVQQWAGDAQSGGPIEQALSRLEDQIQGLDEEVDRIEKRLNTCLLPTQPAEVVTTATRPDSIQKVSSPLSMKLATAISRVEKDCKRLAEIHSRIEL